jgi:hypothetical protein
MKVDIVRTCMLAVVAICLSVIVMFMAQHAHASPPSKAEQTASKDYLRYACGQVTGMDTNRYKDWVVEDVVDNKKHTVGYVVYVSKHTCVFDIDADGHLIAAKIE